MGLSDLTAAGLLDAVAAHVPPALVSPAAWDAVRGAASLLPAALTPSAYLECRLAEGADDVDLIVRVEASGRDVLAGRNPAVSLPAALRADPAWAAVEAFCRAWADDATLLHAVVGHLWLELDLDPARPGVVPGPSLFAAVAPEAAAGMGDAGFAALLDACAQPLGGLAAETRGHVRELFRARPPGASLPYLGFMLARPERAVRLYMGGVGAEALPPFLGRAGWSGPEAEERVPPLPGVPVEVRPRIGLAHVDVAGGLVPRAGVEYTLGRRPQLEGGIREAGFLHALAEAGYCTPDKRGALLGWPGVEARTLPHELWPSRLARRVNCIKVVHRPGHAPEAKGYLLTTAVPFGARTVRAPAAAK